MKKVILLLTINLFAISCTAFYYDGQFDYINDYEYEYHIDKTNKLYDSIRYNYDYSKKLTFRKDKIYYLEKSIVEIDELLTHPISYDLRLELIDLKNEINTEINKIEYIYDTNRDDFNFYYKKGLEFKNKALNEANKDTKYNLLNKALTYFEKALYNAYGNYKNDAKDEIYYIKLEISKLSNELFNKNNYDYDYYFKKALSYKTKANHETLISNRNNYLKKAIYNFERALEISTNYYDKEKIRNMISIIEAELRKDNNINIQIDNHHSNYDKYFELGNYYNKRAAKEYNYHKKQDDYKNALKYYKMALEIKLGTTDYKAITNIEYLIKKINIKLKF